MFNLDKFIGDSVTFRAESMFKADIVANAETLTREIRGKKVCVIGGAVRLPRTRLGHSCEHDGTRCSLGPAATH